MREDIARTRLHEAIRRRRRRQRVVAALAVLAARCGIAAAPHELIDLGQLEVPPCLRLGLGLGLGLGLP